MDKAKVCNRVAVGLYGLFVALVLTFSLLLEGCAGQSAEEIASQVYDRVKQACSVIAVADNQQTSGDQITVVGGIPEDMDGGAAFNKPQDGGVSDGSTD